MLRAKAPNGRNPKQFDKTHAKESFCADRTIVTCWGDTGPFPLFHTPWHKGGRGERMGPFIREEQKWQKAWKKE